MTKQLRPCGKKRAVSRLPLLRSRRDTLEVRLLLAAEYRERAIARASLKALTDTSPDTTALYKKLTSLKSADRSRLVEALVRSENERTIDVFEQLPRRLADVAVEVSERWQGQLKRVGRIYKESPKLLAEVAAWGTREFGYAIQPNDVRNALANLASFKIDCCGYVPGPNAWPDDSIDMT